MLELLMSEWEDRLENEEYEPVSYWKSTIAVLTTRMHTSLLMVCGHSKYDSCVLYFCLVLDPVLKLDYLNAAWEEKYLEIGMKQFKSQVTSFNH